MDQSLCYSSVIMTALLEQAFQKASELSDEEQDLLARVLLEDLTAEGKWDASLASDTSQQMLKSMADEARRDFQRGRGQPGGFDDL